MKLSYYHRDLESDKVAQASRKFQGQARLSWKHWSLDRCQDCLHTKYVCNNTAQKRVDSGVHWRCSIKSTRYADGCIIG